MYREKSVLQRQIDATAKQIDQLVYKLSGLTEEEIKIVEKGKDIKLKKYICSSFLIEYYQWKNLLNLYEV